MEKKGKKKSFIQPVSYSGTLQPTQKPKREERKEAKPRENIRGRQPMVNEAERRRVNRKNIMGRNGKQAEGFTSC